MHLQAAARDPLIRRAPAEAPAARMPRRSRRKPSTAPARLSLGVCPGARQFQFDCFLSFVQPALVVFDLAGSLGRLVQYLLEKRINKR